MSYGSRTNLYLAVYYGFALMKNDYDSYPFCLVVDEKLAKSAGLPHGVLVKNLTAIEREQKFINLKGYVISTDLITNPFRLKMNKLNNQLLVYLRGTMYNQWSKDHPGKKKHKLTLSVPFDVSYEIAVVRRFIDIVTVLQLNFKRSDFEDLELLKSGDLTGPQRAVVTCELGWKRILEEQVKLGKIVLSILKAVKSDPDKNLRKIYMSRVSGADPPSGPIIEARMKIRAYLKQLKSAPFITSQY